MSNMRPCPICQSRATVASEECESCGSIWFDDVEVVEQQYVSGYGARDRCGWLVYNDIPVWNGEIDEWVSRGSAIPASVVVGLVDFLDALRGDSEDKQSLVRLQGLAAKSVTASPPTSQSDEVCVRALKVFADRSLTIAKHGAEVKLLADTGEDAAAIFDWLTAISGDGHSIIAAAGRERLLTQVIRDVFWMARRYARGRSTYAPDVVNRALELLSNLEISIPDDTTLMEDGNSNSTILDVASGLSRFAAMAWGAKDVTRLQNWPGQLTEADAVDYLRWVEDDLREQLVGVGDLVLLTRLDAWLAVRSDAMAVTESFEQPEVGHEP